jgi:signal transduction histidine kinase
LSEGVAFILFSIFFVLFTLYVTLEPNQLLDIIDYESELCLQLKTYWMFLLLMYLIYKGTVIMKQCYHVHISATQKYKSLALIEYEHRLLGKVSKCILHDIATPLSVIGGSIKLLSAKNQTKKEKESIKSSAYNSLNYLESILDNSLNLLRDNRRIDVFNPDLVIKEMLRMVDIRIKKSNIFIMKSLLADCKINGNKASFSRVFLNVIINSIEELENLSNIKKMITLESCVSQNNYVLKIVDSGNGIKDGIVENLSRGHISTKDGCHSGLGLYFVFTTIEEEFNGEVKIISKKNRYTKVILSIPLG